MKRSFSILRQGYPIWLLLAAIIVITQPSCNTEKRVTRRLMKLNKGDLDKVRPWPQNYTYYKYVEMLDDAKIRQEFYRKRKLQARIAKDKQLEQLMANNVSKYQKTIDRLEKDKKFHKIYKLREREINVKLKNEQKVQKNIEKQKARIDKNALKRQKNLEKKRKQGIKERQQRLNNKKKSLEDEKKEHIFENKTNKKALIQKEKELAQLQAIAQELGDADDPSLFEGISLLKKEVSQLTMEIEETEQKIDALIIEIEAFIKENYMPKDSVVKSQMQLSTDPIPQHTKAIIEALPDSIE